MLQFYKKMLALLLGLLLFSALVSVWCIRNTFSSRVLLPAADSEFAWHLSPETDQYQGGRSGVQVHDDRYSLDYSFSLSDVAEYPYAGVLLNFVDAAGEATLLDLTGYHTLSFNVKCAPANVLAFAAHTFEEGITREGDMLSYRSPATYFSCDQHWSSVELDLTRLETPQWWLDKFELKLSMLDYQLNRVPRLVFGSTHQSPMVDSARVQINALELRGRDWRYLYLLAGILGLVWLLAIIWLFRAHTRALTEALKLKLQKDRPLVAYQQLSVEPRQDRDKEAILRYLATEYPNSELNLDGIASATGVGRGKINSILKAELGYTFTGYLNKVRLTEAARLLSDGADPSIAEIAYSVGYKNVSYFNKLFKDEYGCTPKAFRGIYKGERGDS
ncbi:helix-turn-helix domain-containing protein [Gilvimarinus xylanilyticus]|uniref:Helix-turn-helix transcriptional regulator n=1 Tax=Gilvimarinus xylanilyticus TaxID=2944139 RepID=A0A9X2I341_9GAMM|nr:helix-turn-helix transcriptional regulator [Gilvimarinus xylanilyticus]MCP8899948.1 helix-turn-helix transcriptional regulator [Gilvimarinus xylanilyticus]